MPPTGSDSQATWARRPRAPLDQKLDERDGDPIAEMLMIDGTSKGLPDLPKIPLDSDLIDVTPTEAPPETDASRPRMEAISESAIG